MVWIDCKDKMPANDNCLLVWHYPLGQKDIVGGGATIATYGLEDQESKLYERLTQVGYGEK